MGSPEPDREGHSGRPLERPSHEDLRPHRPSRRRRPPRPTGRGRRRLACPVAEFARPGYPEDSSRICGRVGCRCLGVFVVRPVRVAGEWDPHGSHYELRRRSRQGTNGQLESSGYPGRKNSDDPLLTAPSWSESRSFGIRLRVQRAVLGLSAPAKLRLKPSRDRIAPTN